ncbi:serine/threonine-protein kinase [Planomonospora corallina]|uniref:non-specific serine/threonine protein kinase n=1 Tax=Planomonospora corallina TaxID=1806052 RepID=A0ABV8I523_9ACTN
MTVNEVSRIDTRVLAGRYRLLNPLAEGGMGTVWRAADEALRREVAIKELMLPPGVEPQRRQGLYASALREANIAARIEHPSIVTIHDVVVDDGRPWIVMELLPGASLEQTVRSGGPLPPARAARVGLGLLEALSAVHTAGVVHRGVKPGNVFLAPDGKVVLTGFGIAVAEGENDVTSTGSPAGSPGYIAPERLRGERDGPYSDLWSLGATLYFAVEGVPPHPAETPAAVVGRVLAGPPRTPERAGVLGPVLMAMLAPLPVARPAFDAVFRMLEEAVLGRTAAEFALPPLPAGPVPGFSPGDAGGIAGEAGGAAGGVADAPPAPAVPQPAGPESAGPQPAGPPPSRWTREDSGSAPAAASPGRTARAPRSSRALLWAAAEVGGIAAVIGVSLGVGHLVSTGDEPPPPVRLSEKPGAFTAPVDLCGLIPQERAEQLLPALTGGGKPTDAGGCEWTTRGQGLSVTLAGQGEQWGKSPRQAHERFVNQRNSTIPSGQLTWEWPEISAAVRSARSTGPLTVKPVGEEAFGHDLYDNRRTDGLEHSYVTFRVDNLVIEVGYAVVDDSKDGPAIQSGAHTAATWVADALNKQRAAG